MPLNENDKLVLSTGINPESTSAEQIQSYIAIATELLRDLLLARGWTGEQWAEYRKSIVSSELDFIDAELARLEGGADTPTS